MATGGYWWLLVANGRWVGELEAIGRTDICGGCIRSERSGDDIPTNDENEDHGKILRSSINALG